jgi:NDP-sugar pyrophosphorylase family protein
MAAKQAVVLAGGMGRRLGRLSQYRQKCMLPLNGEPILGQVIKTLMASGCVDEILIFAGFLSEEVEKFLSQSTTNPCRVVVDPVLDGGLQALSRSAHLLRDDFLVVHGNIVFDRTLIQGLLRLHSSASAFATIAVTPDLEEARTHPLVCLEGERVTEIKDAEDMGSDEQGVWSYLGVHLLPKQIVTSPDKHWDVSDALQAAIRAGSGVFAYRYHGPFLHLASTFDLHRMREQLSQSHIR